MGISMLSASDFPNKKSQSILTVVKRAMLSGELGDLKSQWDKMSQEHLGMKGLGDSKDVENGQKPWDFDMI